MSESMEQTVLSDIRKRNEDRKAAEATGIIGGVRTAFDVDFLLRYIDANKPLSIDTFEELEDYLQDLNYEHGQDTTAIRARGALFFAYCTDPDGEWFLESTDPQERMEEEEGGWRHYNRMPLDQLRGMMPYAILDEPQPAK